VTAVFHRVAGVWRMAAQASGAGCAIASIPAAVGAQLGLCTGAMPELLGVSWPEHR
jgi:hypothetical protein